MYKIILAVLISAMPLIGLANEVEDNEPIFSKVEIDKSVYGCVPGRSIWLDHSDMIISCLKKEYAVSDAILNRRYNRMISSFNWDMKTSADERTKVRLNSLRKAQRQWIVFRDSECKFVEADEKNEGGEISRYMCLVSATYERANKLSEYLNCPIVFVCPLAAG